MMEFKGTPAPWRCVTFQGEGGMSSTQIMYGTDIVASVSPNRAKPIANAKLIAAAPDLLEALQKVVKHATQIGLSYDVYDIAEAAIQKALK